MSGIGLDEFDLSANMNVFPNPTSGELTIEFGIDYGAVEIRLINSLGQIIDVYSFDSSKAVKLTIDEAPGAYILEVVTDELNPARVKVLKE